MRAMAAIAVLTALIASVPALGAETLTVALRPVSDEKAVFATVESISVVPARGRIGGTVVQLNVREGDPVTRGQAIAIIGDEKLALQMKALDAQIAALQAQSDQAQIDFERTEGLVERGTLPRVKLDETRTALNVAQNSLRARTAERAVVGRYRLAAGEVLDQVPEEADVAAVLGLGERAMTQLLGAEVIQLLRRAGSLGAVRHGREAYLSWASRSALGRAP